MNIERLDAKLDNIIFELFDSLGLEDGTKDRTEDEHDITIDDLKRLYKSFMRYVKMRINIYKDKIKKHRLPNFPEDISEHLVKFIIIQEEKEKCEYNKVSGDLYKPESKKKVEVKCFSSDGPSSFGPSECWDEIYFLDASRFMEDKFICYKVDLSNEHEDWKNIKVNKKQTYYEQCVEKRRPRFAFSQLLDTRKQYITKVFEGGIKDLK